jgi:hypothetical protein
MSAKINARSVAIILALVFDGIVLKAAGGNGQF